MSLFGEKCERCGAQRTKHSFEGVPTCEPCEAKLLAKRQAEGEPRQSCPVDGELMEKVIVLNLVLDRCPGCEGVWLDGGELDLLRRSIEAGMREDLGRALTLGMRF